MSIRFVSPQNTRWVTLQEEVWLDVAGKAVPAGSPSRFQLLGRKGARVEEGVLRRAGVPFAASDPVAPPEPVAIAEPKVSKRKMKKGAEPFVNLRGQTEEE